MVVEKRGRSYRRKFALPAKERNRLTTGLSSDKFPAPTAAEHTHIKSE
jgi:hypothetical protein